MGDACSTWGEERCIQIFVGKPEETRVAGRIILKGN
jgi:hypothetical protein